MLCFQVFLSRIEVAVDKSLWASRSASTACCLGKPMSTRRAMLASEGSGAAACPKNKSENMTK